MTVEVYWVFSIFCFQYFAFHWQIKIETVTRTNLTFLLKLHHFPKIG